MKHIVNDYIRPLLEITTVLGCKVNCKYCPQELLINSYFKDNKQRERVLSIETFKKCIDKLPPNSTILFSGAAEPMLNPDVYEMIIYACSSKPRVRLFTTLEGMTIDGFDRIKDLEYQNVFLHAPDAEGYARITMDDRYFEILDRIMWKKKKNGDWWIDGCSCQGTYHKDFLKHANPDVRGVNQKTPLMDRAGNLPYTELLKKENKGRILCGESIPTLNHFMLLPDGTVCLCNMDYGLKHVLGNLKDMSYKEICESDELKSIHASMKKRGDYDIICRNCTFGRSYKDVLSAIFH